MHINYPFCHFENNKKVTLKVASMLHTFSITKKTKKEPPESTCTAFVIKFFINFSYFDIFYFL
jgi:hypothetical protein